MHSIDSDIEFVTKMLEGNLKRGQSARLLATRIVKLVRDNHAEEIGDMFGQFIKTQLRTEYE